LLGVAVDPDFGSTGLNYVYLSYTFKKYGVCHTPYWTPTNPDNPVNRVSRFVMSGDTINPSSENVLIDNIPSPVGYHNVGDLCFGKDRYLYVTVGDGKCDYAGDSDCHNKNDASRDPHVLLGKILRITREGEIPGTNPYIGTDSARCNLTGRTDVGKKCQETFASGLRNPFRFAFDPDASGTRFFINDVGGPRWEEIDKGKKGADYAWNLCEGNHDNLNWPGSVNCSAAPYTPPIHEYSHDTGCTAITGGAFVPNGVWPAEYDNSYLYGDYVCNKIFELKPKSRGGFTQTEFASGLGEGGPIAMAFGPYGSGEALYYSTYGNGGEVRRITSADDDEPGKPEALHFLLRRDLAQEREYSERPNVAGDSW
jgi:glucose/arabinose dehydrogenase